jgi:hypothetical protein
LLFERLDLIHRWYGRMINPDTGRLEYLYVPQTDSFIRTNSPIRDIASVWDVELVEAFLGRSELQALIDRSIAHYVPYVVDRDGVAILDSDRLREPSSIAHSAFMILALLHARPPHRTREIRRLADGITGQQRADGSYRVHFDDLPDQGEELYAGEAMLALLESYAELGDAGHLESAERGVAYYDAQYFEGGRVGADLLVFFANWQSQAGRLLAEHASNAATARRAATYLFRMHDRIIDRGFYDAIARQPGEQVSVEVACALEGLSEAYALARVSDTARARRYEACICAGLTYLFDLQCTRGGTERERGGFGFTRTERQQRVDITGHAASAFIKSAQNGIECAAPGVLSS